MKSKFLFLFIGFTLLSKINFAQIGFAALSNTEQYRYEKGLYSLSNESHTSFKPYLIKDLKIISFFDSLQNTVLPTKPFYKTLAGRKIFKEHLLEVREDDYHLYFDPLMDISGGNDSYNSKSFKNNTRGAGIGGSVGKRFSFNATFYENQSTFPYYIDSTIKLTRVVPGTGRVKGTGPYDYAWATGSLTYELNKHFTFQFGNDKIFIGDGYRSLLLSDNAFNYPHVKIITDIWKFRYVNIFAEMQDISIKDQQDNEPFQRKYTSMHYLDLNIGKRASIGVFESVVWHSDSTGRRGFDIGYLNPFIFFRPVEFSIGSPDNVLMGFNAKYKITNKTTAYAQLILDEFLIKEVRAGKGWWGNKQGWQLGVKSFDLFGVKNLYGQLEYNAVRPFTYQHRETLGNYGHYGQSLAHPMGANFYEIVGIGNYRYKRWNVEGKFNYYVAGLDSGGYNFGQNIFLPYVTRANEYGNEIGQGEKHTISIVTMALYYEFNPITHLSGFIEATSRNDKSDANNISEMIIQAGIKTRLFNRYYDF
jgi:hypothetical protein